MEPGPEYSDSEINYSYYTDFKRILLQSMPKVSNTIYNHPFILKRTATFQRYYSASIIFS